MDASVSPQLDSSLNDSVTDGEENHSEASPSPQIATVAELEDEDESVTDTQKRREILSRRPSYRKILNELSTDTPAVPKIEEEKAEEELPNSSGSSPSVPTSIYQTSSGQYIAITQGRAIQLTSPGAEALQGGQTLAVASSATPQPGATILQCAAQPGDTPQQFYIQGGQVLIQGEGTWRHLIPRPQPGLI